MKLYDTRTAQEREFLPAGDRVKMYVCGVTPYAPSHVGHAMSYVIFDVLLRYLNFLGYAVDHVQNFTDVDDKIIQTAQNEGIGTQELADRNIAEFMENMEKLNIRRAQAYPRATHEVPRIIKVVDSLIDKGYAYPSDGSVYFRVSKAQDYGSLSHRTLEGMQAGVRVKVDTAKENPMDFALWKAGKAGEPTWDSPWGPGRPGWHIECTAMSLEYLGDTLDIHGGGQDLIFPHHENESAQSQAHTGKAPFANYWVHNGLLNMGDEKMSKSIGNLVLVQDVLQRYSADGLRIFFLGSHYRSPLTYSEEAISATEKAAERLRNALRSGLENGQDSLDPQEFEKRFVEAMDSDLNTPQAMAALFDLARDINKSKESGMEVTRAQETLRKLGDVLGLTFQDSQNSRSSKESGALIELLIFTRGNLRAAGQYALADKVRDGLTELGISLEDTANGTEWKYSHG